MATKFNYKKCLDVRGGFNVPKAKSYLEELGIKATKSVLTFIKENKKLPPALKEEEHPAVPEEEEKREEEPAEEPKAEVPKEPIAPFMEEPKAPVEEPYRHKSRASQAPITPIIPAPVTGQAKQTPSLNEFKVPTEAGKPVPPPTRPSNAPSNQFSVATTGGSVTTSLPPVVEKRAAEIMASPAMVKTLDQRKAEVHYRESGDNEKNCGKCSKIVDEATGGNVKEAYPCRNLGCHVAKTTVCDQFGGK